GNRPGWTFLGYTWEYNGKTYTENGANGAVSIPNGCTVKPVWEINTYNITFNGGEGWVAEDASGLPSNQTNIAYDASVANPGTPKSLGYTFNGWKSSSTGSIVNFANPTKMSDLVSSSEAAGATVTLTAQWTPIQYTLEYNANTSALKGESTPSYSSKTSAGFTIAQVRSNSVKIAQAGPTYFGYSFDKWAWTDSANASNNFDATVNTTITVDMFKKLFGASDNATSKTKATFNAKWTPWTYNIIWNGNGGKKDNNGEVTTAGIKYDATIAEGDRPTFTYTGRTQTGWDTQSTSTGNGNANSLNVWDLVKVAKTSGQSVSNTEGCDIEIYALWLVDEDGGKYTVESYFKNASGGYDKAADTICVAPITSKADISNSLEFHTSNRTERFWDANKSNYYVFDESNSLNKLVQADGENLTDNPSETILKVYYKGAFKVMLQSGSEGGWGSSTTKEIRPTNTTWYDFGANIENDINNNKPSANEPNDYVFDSYSVIEPAGANINSIEGDVTLTSNWKQIEYRLTYARDNNYKGDKLTLPVFGDNASTKVYYWDNLKDNSEIDFEVPSTETGYYFDGWYNGTDSAATKLNKIKFDGFQSTGDASIKEMTVYGRCGLNTYTLGFYKTQDFSGTPFDSFTLTVDDSASHAIKTLSTNDGTANGDGTSNADKPFGYALLSWKADRADGKADNADGAKNVFAPGDTIAGTQLKELIKVAGLSDTDRNINLYAQWNAVYNVAVPVADQTKTLNINLTTREAKAEGVSVYNYTPRDVKLQANSTITSSQLATARSLFPKSDGTVRTDNELNDLISHLKFEYDGTKFAVNDATPTTLRNTSAGKIGAATFDASANKVTMQGIKDDLELLIGDDLTGAEQAQFQEDVWASLMKALEASGAQESDFGKSVFSTIKWTISLPDTEGNDSSTVWVFPNATDAPVKAA
ncbi:InlB B-repeat-containing protein, partial [Adlercreutzia sp. ZJ154]|uniref:InlB B-repeat-containing protein n=1 Tax=Adlercreutzia sp. ZJ154 TaxID=2709790 RepID=UPI0019816580